MISDNILKWYTDEVLRDKYNIKGWDLIEKQIKEKKTKLVFETSNTKISLEFKDLSETTIIFNNMVCKEERPKTKINGVEYYLEEAVWTEVFTERLLNRGIELADMTIEEIEATAIGCIEKAFERMASIKTNNNLSLFDEDKKNDIEEAEIIEVTESGNSNQNLLEDKTDKKEEDNPDEVDKTDEIEEEKPKKRGRKPKNQNRDEE